MTDAVDHTPELLQLSTDERLAAYMLILQGCTHIWSKNKLQEDRLMPALTALIPLTVKDPYFLAHLTAYLATHSKSKDLKVVTAYVATLSTADGTPFSPGSSYLKPNLREVGIAALLLLDPKLALRVRAIAERKYGIPGYMNESRHCPSLLRTALKRYLEYRENNLPMMQGAVRSGMRGIIKHLYRSLHLTPPTAIAELLRWKQKDGRITLTQKVSLFEGKSEAEIAACIQAQHLPYLHVLGELAHIHQRITPAIAVALLEQMTGNQAIILRKTLEDAGILTDPEVLTLYEEKVSSATTALDRSETLARRASDTVRKVLQVAKSVQRKEASRGLGKIYLHIDFSGSMTGAIEFAKDRGAILAECVEHPQEQFRWGLFGSTGLELPLPETFIQDAFRAQLFGRVPNGSTNCFSLYPQARAFGADIDIFVTDQLHTDGNLTEKIRMFHDQHPELMKPKACVIVYFEPNGDFWGAEVQAIEHAYAANGIPVAVLKPSTLTEAALVTEAVRQAMKGPRAVIDEIMDTPLLTLPSYYHVLTQKGT